MTEIAKPSDLARKLTLQWLEIVLSLNDGPQRFQAQLIQASEAEPKDSDDVAALIGLAHAAITISGQDALSASWYRDYAQRLLCRAVDGLALVEATRERAGAGLN